MRKYQYLYIINIFKSIVNEFYQIQQTYFSHHIQFEYFLYFLRVFFFTLKSTNMFVIHVLVKVFYAWLLLSFADWVILYYIEEVKAILMVCFEVNLHSSI